MSRKQPKELRSARWFLPDDFRSFGHRSRMSQMVRFWHKADITAVLIYVRFWG
jgi:hypothetical protein